MTDKYYLSNGVIVPPCKVGQTVWILFSIEKTIESREIESITQRQKSWTIRFTNGDCFTVWDNADDENFGKTYSSPKGKQSRRLLKGVGIMREILFRGIIKSDNSRYKRGQWAVGDLVRLQDGNDGKPHIYGCGEVFAETVGQYTGLTDKNGTKIFEGDIVKVYEDIDYRIGTHKSNRKTRTIIGVVIFDEKRFEYHIKNEEYNLTLFRLSKRDTNEVIGNIHDNPELLKECEG